MSETTLEMARLIELNDDFSGVKDGGEDVAVQFNPESLKLAFANEVVQPEGGDQASGSAGRQFVGAGTTTLSVTLWFDVTAMDSAPVDDVRRLTRKVLYFMTPKPFEGDEEKFVPPAVRFQWASLIFDGLVDSMEENLEFFSPEGKPLRANMSLGFSQQKILVSDFAGDGRIGERPSAQRGTQPLTPAKEGDSLQDMAAAKGKGGDWQGIAAANGIEDPLRMQAGALVNLNAKIAAPSFGVSGPGLSLGVSGPSLSASAGFGASLGASGPSASASLGLPTVVTPPLPRLRIE